MTTLQEHEGHLWLEDMEPGAHGVRAWKQLWFRLDEGYLRYFYKEDDIEPVAAVPCRGIVARSVGKSRVGKHAFRLDVTKQEDGRYKYVLAGDDEADSIVWLEFLRDHGASVKLEKIRVRARAPAIGEKKSARAHSPTPHSHALRTRSRRS